MRSILLDKIFYHSIGAMGWNIILGITALALDMILDIPPLPIPRWISITIGAVLLCLYLIVAYWTARSLPKNYKGKRLVTKKAYALSRHPIYMGIMFFFNPSIIFLFQSLLYLAILIPVWIVWYYSIKVEEQENVRIFGHQYLKYKEKTPILIPTPSSLRRSLKREKNNQ